MRILQSTIQEPEAFYGLREKMSAYCIVGVTVRNFDYLLTEDEKEPALTLIDFKSIFFDFLPSPDKKYDDYSCDIAGEIAKISYEESLATINHFVYCGGLVGDYPGSGESVPQGLRALAEENLNNFWIEVAKCIALPPTHVYIHDPDDDTCFRRGSIWNFCYIYLNNDTKQGIVLAGDCSFD